MIFNRFATVTFALFLGVAGMSRAYAVPALAGSRVRPESRRLGYASGRVTGYPATGFSRRNHRRAEGL